MKIKLKKVTFVLKNGQKVSLFTPLEKAYDLMKNGKAIKERGFMNQYEMENA